jgi:hypothetical protein
MTNAENSGAAAPEAKVKKVNEAIINGRMPVAVVAQIRFGNNKADATKTLAPLYGTTAGKIDDIKKNRNFAYVTQDFRPTQLQKDEGVAWLQRHPKYKDGAVDGPIVELENTGVATESEASVFEAARVAARGQATTTKEGEVADGGGGNRKPKREKKVKAETATEGASAPTADALLG